MSFDFITKRVWADKAAFLVIFIVGLLIAQSISSRRTKIEFCAPVELDYMGVSASVPVGNGWQSVKGWVYEDNSYSLSSFFSLGGSVPTAAAHCRYFLAATDVSYETQIQQKVRDAGATVIEQGTLPNGASTIEWARLKVPSAETRAGYDMLFGVGQLANGRIIQIEVRWSSQQKQMAEKVFEKMAAGLEFKDSPVQDCGIKIVGQLKSKGFSRFLPEGNKQNYFLINDTKNQPIGYIVDILADLGDQVNMNIQVASSFYIRGRRSREQVIIFQGNNDLGEFIWKGESASRFGRSGVEGVFDHTGVLTVKEYGTFIFGKRPDMAEAEPFEERFYRPGPAAIPDVLADLIYAELLESDCEQIMVDVVRYDGSIIPVIISKISRDETAAGKMSSYVLRLDFLDGRNSYAQVYLDDKQEIFREALHQEGTYIIERSSADELTKLFPEKSGDITKP